MAITIPYDDLDLRGDETSASSVELLARVLSGRMNNWWDRHHDEYLLQFAYISESRLIAGIDFSILPKKIPHEIAMNDPDLAYYRMRCPGYYAIFDVTYHGNRRRSAIAQELWRFRHENFFSISPEDVATEKFVCKFRAIPEEELLICQASSFREASEGSGYVSIVDADSVARAEEQFGKKSLPPVWKNLGDSWHRESMHCIITSREIYREEVLLP
jgi:hypothetical protein